MLSAFFTPVSLFCVYKMNETDYPYMGIHKVFTFIYKKNFKMSFIQQIHSSASSMHILRHLIHISQ